VPHSLPDEGSKEQRYLVVYGDWGGSLDLVAPMRLVRCSEAILDSLAKEIGRLDEDNEDATEVMYVDVVPGDWIVISSDEEPVPDDVDWVYNRVRATNRVYVSRSLRDLDVTDNIVDVLAGRSQDIEHIFRPNLRRLLAEAKSGRCSQERFEQIVVQLLRSMKGCWAERWSPVREDDEPYPDVHSQSPLYEEKSVAMEVNCAIDVDSIERKLRHIAIVGKSGDLSFREHPGIVHRRALFSTVAAIGISRESLKYAIRHKVALVPIETLEEVVGLVESGITLRELAERLVNIGLTTRRQP
jgi:hypothetical protein